MSSIGQVPNSTRTRKLCDNIILKDYGELKIRRKIINDLRSQLCVATKSENFQEVYSKVKKEARIKVKTRNCHYRDVFSINKNIVKHWTRWLSLTSVPGLYSDLDVEKGKYEGGFKVWESTGDLINFLTRDHNIIDNLLHNTTPLNVLEVGSGAALPSMALLSRLVGDSQTRGAYQFHLQDYNWQVLVSLSLLNFSVNFPLDFVEALLSTKSLRFFYGHWREFQSDTKYNLIIMSEVIYNAENYEFLHKLLERHLDENGYILLATKDTYFGLTGNLYSWIEFINTQKVFHLCKQIRISSTNIPRSIVIFRHIRNEVSFNSSSH